MAMERTAEYSQWLKTATPGRQHTYHTGFLMADRLSRVVLGNGHPIYARNALDSFARKVMKDADEGRVLLVQRKLDDWVYEYIAVKARPQVRH